MENNKPCSSSKVVASSSLDEPSTAQMAQYESATKGDHVWFVCSHTRPTYCNVCKEALSGVAWHGMSCEVCKIKTHKRCMNQLNQRCKWSTLDAIGSQAIYDDEQYSVMPHQWLEGNLPVSAKCSVCDRVCGSMLRLQDWRCLWCRAMVHTSCKDSYPKRCPLGACRISVLPPVSVRQLNADGSCCLVASRSGSTSPLLVLVNTKSGDNQGVKFLRRFKQLLNPAQVYDLTNGGPEFGLRFFQVFDLFRVLVCGGDGSVGWVLTALDHLSLLTKCQVGVLPLGTGNDLARVLGWGNAFDDDAQLLQLIEKFERAHVKMLDRWSILTYEGPTMCAHRRNSMITHYEDSVACHLSKILSSDDHGVVISSAKVLCETVKDFLTEVGKSYNETDGEGEESQDNSIAKECSVLRQKLDNLLSALTHESAEAAAVSESGIEPDGSSSDSVPEMREHSRRLEQKFIQREALMSRANSLKKAIRQIIDHAEQAVDEQNQQTEERRKKSRRLLARRPFARKSKSTEKAVKMTKQKSLTVSSVSGNSSTTEPETSSAAPSPSLRSVEPKFSYCTPSKNLAEDLPLGNSDSTVPDDPSMVAKLLVVPEAVNIQPPTPGNVSPVFGNDASSSSSMDRRALTSEIVGAKLFSPEHRTLSDSEELRRDDVRLSKLIEFPKTSFSDSSLKDLISFAASPSASRKISSGSTLRVGDRRPSTSRRILPAVGRGLIASGLTCGSLIAEVLLMNADVLGVAASPMMDFEDIPSEQYFEKKVMNNYFGVGLDAKIALEFHNKREESTDKSRSRSKLFMLYGMLGTKELLQRTYKNLEQRVHLECDGHRIQLPSLQGIAVLNIPSYQGGANFWGSSKSDEVFSAQSFDDKVLEVMAVFGVIHCATSRVIKLQNHRIAQIQRWRCPGVGSAARFFIYNLKSLDLPDKCRHVKIIITGDEPIPVQVDGEAWMQPPGYIQIVHKNRAQVLVRNRQFEATLKTWTERLKQEQKSSVCVLPGFTEEESGSALNFVESFNNFTSCIRKACGENDRFDRLFVDLLPQATCLCQKLCPRKLSEVPHLHYHLTDALACAKQMSHAMRNFLSNGGAADTLLHSTVDGMEQAERVLLDDIRLFSRVLTLSQSSTSLDQAGPSVCSSPDKSSTTTTNALKFPRNIFRRWMKKSAASSKKSAAYFWNVACVGQWLESLNFDEYKANFAAHDITGRELLQLERRDLKELGVTKVGHIKRLQQAIKELNDEASTKKTKQRATNDESVSSV